MLLSWYWQRNGADGRRPSGVGHTKSKWHRTRDGRTTLCGLDTLGERSGAKFVKKLVTSRPAYLELDLCKACERRAK